MQDVYLTAADVASAEEAAQQATAARESIMRGSSIIERRDKAAGLDVVLSTLSGGVLTPLD